MKKILVVLSLIIIVGISTVIYFNNENNTRINKEQKKILEEKELLASINDSYYESVITDKQLVLYKRDNNKYVQSGTLSKNQVLNLEKIDTITLDTKYFKIEGLDYYVYYNDIKPFKEKVIVNTDYKNYIPFNELIETLNTNLYKDDKLIYKLDDALKAKVIMKDENKYYIEFNNDLFYVKKEDIKNIEVVEYDKEIAKEITVLNYHFFYEDENNVCNEILCVSRSNFDAQLKYLHDNNYYTLTTRELELFLDKKINLPKNSVLITVDDGAYGTTTVLPETLKKYNMRATLFLITSFNDHNQFRKFDNIELHSHSNNMHNVGVCYGGQGGGIKCLPESEILADLQITKDLLNDTKYFAYPFYEYNSRAVEILKKSGFTMAFIGGNKKVKPGDNKMLLNRYLMFDTTSMSDFLKKL